MMKISEASALSVVEWIGSGVGRLVETIDLARLIAVVRRMVAGCGGERGSRGDKGV